MKMNCYKYHCKKSLNLYLILGFAWVASDCTPCNSTIGGGSLICGEAKARDTSVAFEMSLKQYFVKKGKIEFLYRKDSTKEKDGWISGFFSMFVDETAVLEDNNTEDDPNEWKYFAYDVFPGMKDISFIYQKYNTEENRYMGFEMKELKVIGTEYSDLECTPCTKGFS